MTFASAVLHWYYPKVISRLLLESGWRKLYISLLAIQLPLKYSWSFKHILSCMSSISQQMQDIDRMWA